MNRFVRDMLARDRRDRRVGQDNDMRNPYGSRGGYVRDRGEYIVRGDYRQDGHYPMEYDYDYDYARRDRDYDYDYARGGRRRDYARRDRRGDYGYDYAYDYASEDEMKLSKEDMMAWKRALMNADGTKGEKYTKQQVQQTLQTMGINPEEYGGIDTMCMAVNAMYSDYCSVAKMFGVDRADFYVGLAKAFLDDKDFDGEPAEKLYLYYKCIVEKDD